MTGYRVCEFRHEVLMAKSKEHSKDILFFAVVVALAPHLFWRSQRLSIEYTQASIDYKQRLERDCVGSISILCCFDRKIAARTAQLTS